MQLQNRSRNNFVLESLAACPSADSKLVMYFLVNIAFVNYLDNLTDSLKFPILLNWTTHEQTLLISLQTFDINPDLLEAPKTLKDFVHQFWHKKEICDLQKGIIMVKIWLTKIAFFNS